MHFEFRAEAYNIFMDMQFAIIAGDSGSGANAVNSDSNKFPSNNFLFTGTAHNARIPAIGSEVCVLGHGVA